MPTIPGSISLSGYIAPTATEDTYAVTDETYNRGGYRTVATIAERNAITSDRRKEGMLVKVLADTKFYTLTGGILDANWVEQVMGGSGGSSTFLGLTDTPSAYTGQALKGVRVNATATALEFADLAAGGTVTSVTSANGALTVTTGTTTPVLTVVSAPKLTTSRSINGIAFDGTADITVADSTKVVANAAITAATKTKVTYDAKGLVTSGADATTADIADSTNKRYVTDAQLTVIGNTSNTNTGDNATNSQYSGLAATIAGKKTDSMSTNKILGRSSALTGVIEEISIGSGLTLSAGTLTASGGTVTSVTGTAPIVSSGGTTPAISISAATTSAAGSMSAADKTKLDGVATGATANTGGTPAIVLGTANTPGVSTNFLRRDDTILAFDAVAPSTQAFGDTAVVGTAAVAARRDHKHAMPASTKDTTAATGILKGNGTTVSAATVRVDYAEPTTSLATGILKNTTTTGAHTIATGADLPVMTATVGGAVPTPPNNTTTFLRGDGTFAAPTGSGDVVGPASAVGDNIAVFNSTTGKIIKDGGTKVSDLTTSIAGKKVYHGVVARPIGAGNPLPTTITTTTFTLGAATNPISYYYQGALVTVTTNKTATLTDGTAGLYYVYFNAATGNILATKNFPGLTINSNVLIAIVCWNGTNYGLVYDERHSYTRDLDWHEWAHDTVGIRYQSGITLTHNGGTGAAATFAVTSGAIHDEDIDFVISAQTTGRLFYQTGASTYGFVTTLSARPGYLGANNRPNVVNSTGYVLTQVASAVNRYVNVFVYASTDLSGSIYFITETVTNTIAGQGGYTSLANARAVPFPNLANTNMTPELKPIYRLIWRADGVLQAIDTTLDDYRLVSSLPQGAGTTSIVASSVGVTAVGNLTSTNVQSALEELQVEVTASNAREMLISKSTFNGIALEPGIYKNGSTIKQITGYRLTSNATDFQITIGATSYTKDSVFPIELAANAELLIDDVTIANTYNIGNVILILE